MTFKYCLWNSLDIESDPYNAFSSFYHINFMSLFMFILKIIFLTHYLYYISYVIFYFFQFIILSEMFNHSISYGWLHNWSWFKKKKKKWDFIIRDKVPLHCKYPHLRKIRLICLYWLEQTWCHNIKRNLWFN